MMMKKVIGLLVMMSLLLGISKAQIPYFQHYSLLKKK